MIVKVQLSLGFSKKVGSPALTLATPPMMLIYDKPGSRSPILLQQPASREVLDLFETGCFKKYFHAKVLKNGLLQINKEAPEQSW